MNLFSVALTLSLIVGFVCMVDAQDIQISGTVLDKETTKPVPFASITVVNSNYGTAGGEDGSFSLKLEPVHTQGRLKISCIGYSSVTFSIDSLRSIEFLKIRLQPEVIKLEEVEVIASSIDPVEILTKAINAIPQNNYMKDYYLEYYSTITSKDSSSDYRYKLETILRDYNMKGVHKFVYTEQREYGTQPIPNSKCGLPAHFELSEMDLLRSPLKIGVFNLSNIREFKLKYEGVVNYERDTVYVISYFAPNPSGRITGVGNTPKNYFYGGRIYISVTSNAVVRHSLEQGIERNGRLIHEILYRKINSYYFPYYIKGTRILDIKKNFKPENTNILILRDANLEKVDLIAGYDNCNRPAFNKSFWDKNYPR